MSEWTILTPTHGPDDHVVLARRSALGWILSYGYVEDDIGKENPFAASVDLTEAELGRLNEMAKDAADGPR